uniref:hypothetical protein n=1 Tax=Burkholderia pseudomallei TaxID=28450 RepID=UPI002468CE2C|nr:hypothetical protein [Burkholderia pseudomallei]
MELALTAVARCAGARIRAVNCAAGIGRLAGEVERDRSLLVVERNGRVAMPRHCLHQLFEAQAARGNAIAVICGRRALSYAELNRVCEPPRPLPARSGRAGRTARGDLHARRGLEMLIGMLAMLKAGGAYVPLDPAIRRSA